MGSWRSPQSQSICLTMPPSLHPSSLTPMISSSPPPACSRGRLVQARGGLPGCSEVRARKVLRFGRPIDPLAGRSLHRSGSVVHVEAKGCPRLHGTAYVGWWRDPADLEEITMKDHACIGFVSRYDPVICSTVVQDVQTQSTTHKVHSLTPPAVATRPEGQVVRPGGASSRGRTTDQLLLVPVSRDPVYRPPPQLTSNPYQLPVAVRLAVAVVVPSQRRTALSHSARPESHVLARSLQSLSSQSPSSHLTRTIRHPPPRSEGVRQDRRDPAGLRG